MDRIIEVKVGGNHLSKDNKNAGVRGEANVTKLRITFDEGWDGYAKTVTFFDAYGNNPVKRIQGVDLLEDITKDTRTYITPIPQEPMAIAGEMTFIIDGYLDGKRQRSISDKLVVKDAPIADDAGEPAGPTPTQAEQLQSQIDKVVEDIQATAKAKEATKTYRDEAERFRNDASEYKDTAVECARQAVNAVGKTSYIGDNGNWYAWDVDAEAFYDTGVRAQAGSTVYLGDNPPLDAGVWVDPDGDEYISHSPIMQVPMEEDWGADEEYWYIWSDVQRKYVNTGVPARGAQGDKGDTPIKGVDYWNSEDIDEIQGYIDEKTEIIRSDMEGLQAQLNEEAHFRGYLSTNAKIKALKATPNDFAYSAESGTKWVYDEVNGWENTGTPVPDQLTPASNATPLVDGEASAGQSNEYARGDHRHPTDTTRASVEALNALRGDVEHYSTKVDEAIENVISWDKSNTLEFTKDTAKIHSVDNSSVATFSALNLYGESVQDGTPTPDAPIDIVSVENPVVRVTGNNLFNIDAITHTINNGDGTLTVSSYPTYSGVNIKKACPVVKIGDRIVFRFDTTSNIKQIYLSNGKYITANTPFIVTEEYLNGEIMFYCNRVDGVNSPATISNIRVTLEGCPDVYEPYIEPQEVVLDGITLRGLQSTKGLFVDEIIVDGKNKTVKHIQRVHYWNSLNHTGGWSATGLNEDANIVKYSALICKPKWNEGGVALCTHFKYTTGGYTPNVYWEFTPGDTSARAYFKVPLDQYPTPADFKAFMNANEVELICKLDVPVETDITNTEAGQALLELHTNYLDTTVISDADCKFTYTTDISTAYNQLLNRVATLEAATVNNI